MRLKPTNDTARLLCVSIAPGVLAAETHSFNTFYVFLVLVAVLFGVMDSGKGKGGIR